MQSSFTLKCKDAVLLPSCSLCPVVWKSDMLERFIRHGNIAHSIELWHVAGCRGDHKSRLKSQLLAYMFENHIMELLLLVSQCTTQVSVPAWTWTFLLIRIQNSSHDMPHLFS